MHQIKDLHFQKQILSLFDHVSNEYARDRLISILTELPGSIEEIQSRQQMCKAILHHSFLFGSFSYARIELNEAFIATTNNKQRGELLLGNRLSFYSPFPSIAHQQQQGKTIMILSFFARIYNAYFKDLDISLFPTFYQRSLQNIQQLFISLAIDHYDIQNAKNNIRPQRFIQILQILEQQVRSGAIENFWNDFFLFEAYLAIAKGIRKYELQFPTFSDDEFSVHDFYHPLVKNAIANSIDVTSTVELLTGPNMSGKSTLFRALGLCVYLAHTGIAVPASSCTLPYFDHISIAINLNDDVESGYSHFMTEVITLKNVVTAAANEQRCFAICDELFRGTNSDDALAISLATIKGLTQYSGSFFFISTHLHGLRELISAGDLVSLRHIDCQLSGGRPEFTYRLKKGWSDVKIGQIIFQQSGLEELLNNELPGC